MSDVADAKTERPPARRRIGKNAIRVGLGLLVGLAITEVAFYVRDGGAFPHLNVYVEDAERGARLRPGASERIRFSNNPVTSVRINSEGYRGAEWPSPTADETVVVGDSQVLGLGVEENETFSSILQTSLGGGAVVRNLGVPTYGPPEYNAVIDEALKKRPAKTVVYVVNLANDLFEAQRKNKDRHVIWDGWAVRKETAPKSVTSFPGRGLFYTSSHAVFALRGFVHAREASDSEQGFASEGTWNDIGDAAVAAQAERVRADAETTRLAQLHRAQINYADDRANLAAQKLDQRVIDQVPYDQRRDDRAENDPKYMPKQALFEASRLSPGDIVTIDYGESGRSVRVNADHIRRGAAVRVAFEKKVREDAQAKKDAETLGAFEKRDEEAKKAAALRSAVPPKAVSLSPLAPALREAKASCDKHGARLVVVVLPIDVQVSKTEWAKYGVEAVDMESTIILNEDVAEAARSVGADVYDALPALRAAEPGAFLDGDIHMTPKGHRAVGEALAKALRAPRLAMPGEGLPAARSWPPLHEEWTEQTEISVRESDPAGCETKKVREWLGIFCRHKPLAAGVVVTSGTEVIAGAVPGGSLLIAPAIPGQDLKATFAYEGASRDFTVKGDTDLGFTKPLPARAEIATKPTAETDAFCKCFIGANPGKTCTDATTVGDADCARSFANDCKKLLSCSEGDPLASSAVRARLCPCRRRAPMHGALLEGRAVQERTLHGLAGRSGVHVRICLAVALACALVGCREERPKRTAPVIARALPDAGASHVDASTLALARTARDAAVKLAGECRLYSQYDEDDTVRYHDACSWDKEDKKQMLAAAKALVAAAPDAGDARVFIEHVRLFAEWIELAEGGGYNGALAHYQALALAWNGLQPQDPVGIDVHKASSYDNPPDAGPLAWRRCATGPCVVVHKK